MSRFEGYIEGICVMNENYTVNRNCGENSAFSMYKTIGEIGEKG